jgi:hypothetical protein
VTLAIPLRYAGMIKERARNVRLAILLIAGEWLIILYVAPQHHQRYACSTSLSSTSAVLGPILTEVGCLSQWQSRIEHGYATITVTKNSYSFHKRSKHFVNKDFLKVFTSFVKTLYIYVSHTNPLFSYNIKIINGMSL